MDEENSASRPESPKKKIKSNPVSNSEAQPSDSTIPDMNGDSMLKRCCTNSSSIHDIFSILYYFLFVNYLQLFA